MFPYLPYRGVARTTMLEAQEFRPGVQNSGFSNSNWNSEEGDV
jgi:hypothetical protein